MNKYIESVSHLKKKLEKGVSYEKTMHILHKLQKIPISIDLLQATGIGKTVRNLSKLHDNDIKKTARLLCLTWKAIVKEQQEQELEQDHNHDCDQTFNHSLNNKKEPEFDYDIDEEIAVKKEPEFDDSIDEQINKDYAEINHKIKNEYNSNNREAKTSNRESKSSEHKRAKKVESDEEEKNYDSDYDKKHSKSSHKKHKSSHKSKNSESKNPKTEFEAVLELSDEIIKNNKKNSSNKKPESDKSDTKVRHSSNKTNEKSSEKSKKYDEKHKTKGDSNGRNDSSHSVPLALDSNIKLKSLDKMDILSSLPTPNYKPLPNRELIDERVEANRRKTLRPSEDLSLRVQSKKGRTAVFAGHARTNFYTHVHPLEDLCIRVLMDNIDKLCYFGDAPYYLLKPVLQKCNPRQLSRLEKFNPQIMDETDELWQEFCKKEFRGREPDEDEDECWRELYYRGVKERDDKLKNITKHITHRQAKALPVRQTQFSETAKTPREILRKQERAANNNNYNNNNSSFSHSTGHNRNSTANHVKIVPEKPKVAPLMKKALKLQKARFRR